MDIRKLLFFLSLVYFSFFFSGDEFGLFLEKKKNTRITKEIEKKTIEHLLFLRAVSTFQHAKHHFIHRLTQQLIQSSG